MNPFQSSNKEQLENGQVRKGPWTLEEDTLLIHYIARNGEGRWNFLAKCAGLKRTGKSCRLRWLNYLKPDTKRGNLTPQEELMILELHSKWGNRWSKIAQHLPGRTDNEIKNYWRTRVQKQARQLNMESNSQSFINAIRCFYMPRLVQKIDQNSSQSTAMDYEASGTSSLPLESTITSQFPPRKEGGDSFDHSYKDCLSSSACFPSYESSKSSTPLEIPLHPAYPTNAYTWENITHSMDSSAENLYAVDSTYCDMEELASLAYMGQFSETHMAENSWIGVDMINGLRNLDGLDSSGF